MAKLMLRRRRARSRRPRDRSRRDLGDEHHLGAAGEPGGQRDPAGVASHDLAEHDAIVALRGGVEAIQRLGRDLDRGLEAEGVIGGGEVVVNGLGHADHARAALGEELATC
jgi:hypothetical protein